jgi:hypothetical protein
LIEGESPWDRRLIVLSNWVNPILVKETRQALKSKQFSITLMLLTVVVLFWSILSIVGMIPSIYYASNGSFLLLGYSIILIVPALIIIPQAMFRSMASELEDGTFETLSLCTLSPRSILMGKLSVAALQLLIYVSVIAPCIALTYLLRGVTLEIIAMDLLILVSCSLGLSTIAISVASFSKNRVQQVFYSIVLLGAQVGVAFIVGGTLMGLVSTGSAPIEAWIGFGVFLLILIMYGWLFVRCGSCAIGVISENRSTPIRVPILVIGLLISMLSGFFAISMGDTNSMAEMLASAQIFLFMHWGISGTIIMGEQGIIPARARRTLPNSLLGRLFLTWLNPGAGPGYLFTVLGFTGTAATLVVGPAVMLTNASSNVGFPSFLFVMALVCYLVLYLGIVRLICMATLRRVRAGRLVAAFTANLVMIILSVVVTCAMSLGVNNYQSMTYGWYCFPNLFWTLGEIYPYRNFLVGAPEIEMALISLAVCAIAVGIVNVVLTSKDVILLRIDTPTRVLLERAKRRGRDEQEEDCLQ